MSTLDAVSIIRTKRDGHPLSTEQIDWVIDAYTRGEVGDEQMAALAMAIYFNGMDARETTDWTKAMIASGDTLDWSELGRVTADKHSTGGVGDKISIALVPLVATFGVAVPMLSGRGLAHTGGTLDKLESIPGCRVELSRDEMVAALHSPGAIIAGATGDVAPADKKLYALRDITATVDSIPLIASSIMSKKIAGGADSLIIDVKTGNGAFMQDLDSARELARTMVVIGNGAGVRTSAIITDMNVPLGRKVGNALEIEEIVEVLSGRGPADVVELTVLFATRMLAAAGVHLSREEVGAALNDGRALATWKAIIRAQGGDPDAPLPRATHVREVRADRDGYVTRMDALAVGTASWRLGAGRTRPGERVQPAAGIEIVARYGDSVRAGDTLLRLHTDDESRFDSALEELLPGLEIGEAAPPERTLVYEEIK